MSIELTREELFNQVWDRPMTEVAADYGISDLALKRICDKHRIPVPGRGQGNPEAAKFKTNVLQAPKPCYGLHFRLN